MSARAEKMERLLDELGPIVDGDAAAIARHADFLADDDDARDLRHEASGVADRLRHAGADYVPPADLDAKILAALEARGTGRTTQPGPFETAGSSDPESRTSGERPSQSADGKGAPLPRTEIIEMLAPMPPADVAIPAAEKTSTPATNVVSIDAARTRRRRVLQAFGVLSTIGVLGAAAAGLVVLSTGGSDPVADGMVAAPTGTLTATVTRIVRSAGGDEGTGIEVRVAGGSFAAAPVDATLAVGGGIRTDERTRVELALSDGSSIVLNHGTELTLDAAAPRHLRLASGEVLADVAHLEGAPNLVIDTPTGGLEVLGTRFDVTATDELTNVRVTRGKVSLRAADGRAADVDAGEEGVVRAGGAPVVAPVIDLARAVGWAELAQDVTSGDAGTEVIAGIGSLRARRPGEREDHERPLAVARHEVTVRIVGNVARTEVEEVFRNDSDVELEGIYRFPMPPGARIARLALDMNDTMEEAAFVPRDRAAAIWRGVIRNATPVARRERTEEYVWVPGPWRDPALLEWQRGGSFELRVFPIPAHGERRVAIAYTETITPTAEGRRYVYPMAHSRDGSTRVGELALDVRVAGTSHVTTSGYRVTSAADADATHLTYEAHDFLPNGDLVIDYETPDAATEVTYWTYSGDAATSPPERTRERDDDVTAAHRALAADHRGYVTFALRPHLPARTEGDARDYVLVVDSSQSMVGERWERARNLVAGIVAEMDRRDRFTVLACDYECRSIDAGGASARTFRSPSSTEVSAVTAWLGTIEPAGASDIGATLRRATELPSSRDADRPVHVIYVGDGIASAGHRAAGALGTIAEGVAASAHVSITTVGIGQDADTVALASIARSGGGHYVPYVPGERATTAALAVLETSYGISLREPSLVLPAGLSEMAPAALPTIRAGEETIVVARMDQPTVDGEIILRGTVGGEAFEQRYPIHLEGTTAAGNLFVPSLWASGTIERLELGGRGEDVARIVALSRAYHVMSRHTSLLVLESEAMFRAFGIDHDVAAASWTGEEDVAFGTAEGVEAVAGESAVMGAASGPPMADALAGGAVTGGYYGTGGGGSSGGSSGDAASGGGSGAMRAHHGVDLDDAMGDEAEERESRGRRASSEASAADMAAPPAATTASPPRMPVGLSGGGRGRGSWMRRVYYRAGTISRDDDPTFAETEAARRAEEDLRAVPDSRDRHRAAVRALARAGNLARALEVAESWVSRDRLDPEALAARADLVARLGRREEAVRLLSGVVDLRADDVTLHERLVGAFERAGERERACAHRISIAEIDPSSAERVGAAVRCERALGHPALADLVLASTGDDRVRRRAETEASEDVTTAAPRGDFLIEASWRGGDDVDVSIVTADGTRLSWMGGRTTVVGADARAAGRETLGIRRASVGSYLIEVARTGEAVEGPISGELRVRLLGETETIPFTIADGETSTLVARASVRRESRMETVTSGW